MRWLHTVAAGSVLALAGLAVRNALLAGIDTYANYVLHRGQQVSPIAFVGWAAAASILVYVAQGVLRATAGRVRAGSVLLATLVWGALLVRHHHQLTESYFSKGYGEPRVLGRFPFAAGRVVEDQRGAYALHTTTLPDGTRPCGSGTEGPTIVLIGDSYVYGSGLLDDATLCTHLRLAAEAQGLQARWINLGQPGASLRSYADTLDYALTTFQPDLVVVSVLPGDDLRAFDVNDQGPVAGTLTYRVAADLLDGDSLWILLNLFSEVPGVDFWLDAIGKPHLRRLGEAAHAADVPLVLELIARDGELWMLGGYREALDALASPGRQVTTLHAHGLAEQVPEGEEPFLIPGDGHPTGRGNALRAGVILPAIRAALAEGAP